MDGGSCEEGFITVRVRLLFPRMPLYERSFQSRQGNPIYLKYDFCRRRTSAKTLGKTARIRLSRNMFSKFQTSHLRNHKDRLHTVSFQGLNQKPFLMVTIFQDCFHTMSGGSRTRRKSRRRKSNERKERRRKRFMRLVPIARIQMRKLRGKVRLATVVEDSKSNVHSSNSLIACIKCTQIREYDKWYGDFKTSPAASIILHHIR
mmetsp:Transcript_24135/g.58337  ORF Transcript_24135/g.58337 Transcript_24135/m.58337 type:complete len:204 (-) Transcript_24135:518-1129(-)